MKKTLLMIGLIGIVGGGCRGDERAADDAVRADTLVQTGPAALSDGEVLHALMTATDLGAERAERGLHAAQHVDVEVFAQVVRADHLALRAAFGELATNLGVQPSGNEVANALREQTIQSYAALNDVEPEAFDRAFVDAGIEFYQALVDAFDNRLLPSARNAQLREFMRAAQPTLEAHLQRAAQLRSQLEGLAMAEMATPGAAAGQPRPPAAAATAEPAAAAADTAPAAQPPRAPPPVRPDTSRNR